jgi:hypothetical protein
MRRQDEDEAPAMKGCAVGGATFPTKRRNGGAQEQFDKDCVRQVVTMEFSIATAICLGATPNDGHPNAIVRLTNTKDGWIAVLVDVLHAGVVASADGVVA